MTIIILESLDTFLLTIICYNNVINNDDYYISTFKMKVVVCLQD